ncbi:hypothetical protein [Pengzhenrongella phosphoraccumulans]|uniref:hypothetical protein n=1 Tax=Pengzhenrongella phosphoraccumulans TaxID=3114394 RepID=UPI00388D82B8
MSQDEPTPEGATADGDLAARLAALERENAALRDQVAAGATSSDVVAGGPVPRRRHRGRAIAAVVLILLGVLLAPLAVVANWAQRELTDTDRYLATIGPLAADPAIQSALANRLTQVAMAELDVPTLVNDALSALEQNRDLPPRVTTALGALEQPLTSGIESFVRRAATSVVQSDAFTTAWVDANRVAHEQLVKVMQGEPGNVLQVGDQGQLTIQLAGMIDALKQKLVDSGFGIAANIPAVNASFTLVQTTQLVKVRNAYNLLDFVGTWLPWLSIAFLAAGVLTAVRRSRALVFAGLGLALSMVVLGLGLYVGRTLYLGELTGKVQRLDAAQVVFDQIVGFIRASARTVAVVGLVVAAAAYLSGSSDSARSLRGEIGRGFDATRRWAEGRGVTTGPVGAWLFAHKTVVRVVIVALAGLVILLATTLSPSLVITVAVVTGLLLALVELLARPGSLVSASAGDDGAVGARP